MSMETKDLSLFEQMGGTYTEKDGICIRIFRWSRSQNRLRLVSTDCFGFLI